MTFDEMIQSLAKFDVSYTVLTTEKKELVIGIARREDIEKNGPFTPWAGRFVCGGTSAYSSDDIARALKAMQDNLDRSGG